MANNARDQPVAATDVPMCAQPFGNSAASFCSAINRGSEMIQVDSGGAQKEAI